MPKTLSIDLETFSPVDIRDCGSFRYIDDPEFEILLFGYAFGEDEPTVVDLCSGEAIPDEVTDALYSSDYIKTGYNNAFERYALWKHFGRYCPPEQWEDTMVLAAVCGLPLGLGAVGSALGLPEDKAKDKAGKALIKYFCCPCKPTKTNGGRERNYPEHAPEKWAQFIEYMDVELDEAELPTIYQKSLALDRERERVNKAKPVVDMASKLAAQMGFETPEAMLEAASANYRQSEIDALVKDGVHKTVAEVIVNQRLAAKATEPVPVTANESSTEPEPTAQNQTSAEQTPTKRDFQAEVAELLNIRPELQGQQLPEEVQQDAVKNGVRLAMA